jgi:hypothetical protein
MADPILGEDKGTPYTIPPPPADGPNVDIGEKVSWADELPKDLKEAVGSFKSVADLAKSYTEARKHISSTIRVPPSDAPAKDWDDYYKKIGRPESPDKYTKLDKTQVPEGLEWDDAREKKIDKMAHKHGLTDKQALGIKQDLNADAIAEIKAEDDEKANSRIDAEAALKKEWGNAYAGRIAQVARFAKNEGGDEFLAYVKRKGIGNDPELIRFLSKVSESMAADRSIDGSRGVREYGMSPAEAQAKIAEIRSDMKNHPYFNPKHPEHKTAKEYMAELHAAAYPETT